MTPVFFSFMVITKMNFHFRRISDFSYISQDSFSKKKKNLILSFFINMSKRTVPSKKKSPKAQFPSPHKSPHKSSHKSPHKAPHKAPHKSPHKAPHKAPHKSPHKAPHKSPRPHKFQRHQRHLKK